MKVYLVVLRPSFKPDPESWNPVFCVLMDKEEAYRIADNKHGYYVIERIIGELG